MSTTGEHRDHVGAAAAIAAAPEPALVPFGALRALWFQVTGLHCNLACSHCLVDSSPQNRRLAYLEIDAVRATLDEAEALGVKEVYFTGGEPFLHRQLMDMLAAALEVAPTTVLTNGTLIDDGVARRLAMLADASRYSLEVRLSVDDVDPAINDRVRGAGVLERVARAARALDDAGLVPILTTTEIGADREALVAAGGEPIDAPGAPGDCLYDRLRRFLTDLGITRPRVKIMPVFRAGKLAALACSGGVPAGDLDGLDLATLQCHTARVVAADGLYACPILAGAEAARLAPPGALGSGLGAVRLDSPACRTCLATGMTCSNV